jgi:hypothetical protein
MIRILISFLTLLASPTFAAPACPTKADAISPGIRIGYRENPDSHFTITKDGTVIEDAVGDDAWRYESLQSVFLLRYGPHENGAINPKKMEVAKYEVPLSSLPEITEGLKWQGHVTYTSAGETVWQTDMTVTASPHPDLKLGDCSYKAILLVITEPDENGPFVSYLAFLPEFGFGIRTGSFSDSYLDKTIPVSIGLVGDE